MFSEIDRIIFPDSCEVIEMTASQQFVFPIMKNGSSSFLVQVEHRPDWKLITNDDIGNITDTITVIIREPRDRFISGVNTYLQHLNRDYPELDRKTVLWFVNQYLFLNRHYCPQFFWLLHLNRFMSPGTRIELRGMEDLDSLTNVKYGPNIDPPDLEFLESIKSFDWNKLELYFYLDQILFDRIGQTLTLDQLIVDIKKNHHEMYDLIFKNSQQIFNALPKT